MLIEPHSEIHIFRVIQQEKKAVKSAAGGDRTLDITVFSRALSQLSYRGKKKDIKIFFNRVL
jgi:hypothetical protein